MNFRLFLKRMEIDGSVTLGYAAPARRGGGRSSEQDETGEAVLGKKYETRTNKAVGPYR